MLKKWLCIFLFFLPLMAAAQTNFRAILFNTYDSTSLSFTAVKLAGSNIYAMTDNAGEFTMHIPDTSATLSFEISAIGCHTTIEHKITGDAVEKIEIYCAPLQLGDVEIHYYSPEEVLRRAISMIHENYEDSSYISEGFFRSYKNVNGNWRSLMEARSNVLFRLHSKDSTLLADEAFAVEAFRCLPFVNPLEDFYSDEYADLMTENPIYHLEGSSLSPQAYDLFTYTFDPIAPDSLYIINYYARNYSTETHGIANYRGSALFGEASEKGTIVIDSRNFAILKIEKVSTRNPAYTYHKRNNFIYPSAAYTIEFNNAYQLCEYSEVNGKYYISKLMYAFANNFYDTFSWSKAYTIASYFEWYGGNVSYIMTPELASEFEQYRNIDNCPVTSDPAVWSNELPDFYFQKGTDVYSGLQKYKPVQMQSFAGTK